MAEPRWQATPPDFHCEFLGPAVYYWAVWHYADPTPILVEVYLDDERGYLVCTDGERYSAQPEDYLLWWSEPAQAPPVPRYDQKAMERLLFPHGQFDRTVEKSKIDDLLE